MRCAMRHETRAYVFLSTCSVLLVRRSPAQRVLAVIYFSWHALATVQGRACEYHAIIA